MTILVLLEREVHTRCRSGHVAKGIRRDVASLTSMEHWQYVLSMTIRLVLVYKDESCLVSGGTAEMQ
jgi:hypothetical protein